MIKIGMLIADRYEVLEKTGTGGMSVVYRAKDHKLNRIVAIKVLKQEFSDNANFVSKFRVEAQAAAGLMHPNIVNVYDVGEEKGMYYIVMEYVDGITLKKYIEKKSRLTVKEAISIAIQVSMGLQAAHANHVIHRDIKPQNIMISRDGKVKVTDFGIAKAATSNTITSNVMGSVHYTSPEQARGGYSDERSDVYSLGITLFEMLTGRVPFNGETTVAIAIKHIQSPMPSPLEFVPDIPRSVEQIVLKCCEKSPDRRYQNMTELIGDLKQSLIHPNDDFVKVINPDEDGATRMAAPAEQSEIRRRAGNTGRISAASAAAGAYVDAVSASDAEVYAKELRRRDRGYEKAVRTENDDVRSDSYTAAQSYAEAGYAEGEYAGESYAEDARIPNREADYAGSDLYEERYAEEYERRTRRDSYEPRDAHAVRDEYDAQKTHSNSRYADYDERETSSRRPRRQERLDEPLRKNVSRYEDSYGEDRYADNYDPKRERMITVLSILAAIIIGLIIILFAASKMGLLSFGGSNSAAVSTEDGVTLPEMAGQNAEELKNSLNSLGLIPEVTYEESTTVASGIVISAADGSGNALSAGDVVEAGSSVVLTVSTGQSGVAVPDVTGLSRAEAVVKLKQSQFSSITVQDGDSSEVEKGDVMAQSPEAGTKVPTETTITITISTGKGGDDQIQVPDVTGISSEEAMAILSENNLKLGTTTEAETDDPNKVGVVIAQSVKADTFVDANTSVDLTIGKASKTETTTYSYSAEVTAPTSEEAPDYVAGTQVYVVIITADGQTLLNTTTTTFPVPASFTGITSATGTLQMSYASQAADAVNGQRVVTRQLTFTPES